jgi:hypothetical protein
MKANKLVEAADSGIPETIAAKLKSGLSQLATLEPVGDVRGIGLLWAVEFVSDRGSKSAYPPNTNFAGLVSQAALERGLLVYPVQGCVDGDSGDHILIAPPAIITAEQIDWACDQLALSIGDATRRTLN